MKRLFLMLVVAAVGAGTMQVKAQKDDEAKKRQGFFNRLSVGVSASTMGIGIDASTTLNRYFMLRAGVDIMPDISFDTDVDVDIEAGGYNTDSEVNIDGGIKRTEASLLLNIYPFKRSSFFITGGAYFGGNDIVKIKGHNDYLQDLYTQYGGNADIGIVIGDYKLPVDQYGNVSGGIKVNSFRPYVGWGFGRTVPHNRVGFMFEMGLQFHGTPKVYSSAGDLQDLAKQYDADDDFSDILDKLNVYPVIKFRLCGRIF